MRNQNPSSAAPTYVHFPLPMHRFALPAARVAECAGAQGPFEAMHDQLFENQDGFGLKPWSDYATAAGVTDLPTFDTCIKITDPMPRVESGKVPVNKLGIQGTPTVIINCWLLGRPPSAVELRDMIKSILAGKSPVATDGSITK